jgi:hypothetical protein
MTRIKRSPPTATLAERLARYEVVDECWQWRGSQHGNGYGTLPWKGRRYYAHRLSYEFHVGPIPDGLVIDHLCFNRGCIRPEHLEAVTLAENNRRMFASGRWKKKTFRPRLTHCKRGHELTPDSCWVSSSGKRQCKACYKVRAELKRAS